MARDPGREIVPAVQRLRIQHAKRGRLRFTSHRDFQRAFERALRRANVPMAYSAGFSPHPKISYANAAATGVASEAEYVEIGVVQKVDPEALQEVLNEVLPPGFDVLAVVEARTPDFVARLEASVWQVELPGLESEQVMQAITKFLAQSEVLVERLTKSGLRTFDARSAVLRLELQAESAAQALLLKDEPESDQKCAILQLVVRHGTPAVRPDDVLAALTKVAGLVLPVPARVTRLAQGPLSADGWSVSDPLDLDRQTATS
mgnify:CR=1 FL=1